MAAGADVRCAVLALLVLGLLATGGDATGAAPGDGAGGLDAWR